jgi:hypothetical protein
LQEINEGLAREGRADREAVLRYFVELDRCVQAADVTRQQLADARAHLRVAAEGTPVNLPRIAALEDKITFLKGMVSELDAKQSETDTRIFQAFRLK